MKKALWIVGILVVLGLALAVSNLLVGTPEGTALTQAQPKDAQTVKVAHVLEQSCASCHVPGVKPPYYASWPVTKRMVESDMKEGLQEFDLAVGFAPAAAGPVPEPVVARIEREVAEGDMPPASYVALHWNAGLGFDERLLVGERRAEPLLENPGQCPRHEDPARGNAGRAAVQPRAEGQRTHDDVDVRVVEHERRVATGKLHDRRRGGLGEPAQHGPSRVGRTRQQHLVGTGIDARDAGFDTLHEHRQQPRRQPRMAQQLGKQQAAPRPPAPGFSTTALPAVSACTVCTPGSSSG